MQTQFDNPPVSKKVESAIERVIRGRMAPYGYKGIRSYAGLDHDDEPVIFIDVNYGLSERPIDSSATFGLITAVREALAGLGEARFPHVRHHFDEQQKIAS